ncbi:hypothetical protein BJ742DRAFT_825520 [Cladochytrium replicatum]|nr:hypothetical protein BJ742DRAFT_825520 [Cladochytrium replicatum]
MVFPQVQGPGLRYEVGLCIRTGHIVWVNGGKLCGAWPDVKLARLAFTNALGRNEKALADKGYKDDHFIYPSRFKQLGCLSQIFRHSFDLHVECFIAVVNFVQLNIENV